MKKINKHVQKEITLQAILEMQQNLGKLTQAIEHLTDQSKNHSEKLDKISHKVSVAQGVAITAAIILTALGSIATFLLNKIWDTIIPLLQLFFYNTKNNVK